jgi:5-carboxymethyl-2-hydroxymuconate isomerase
MPHITVEYSANLEERLDVGVLVTAVHDASVATGVFDLKAIRTRAERRDVYTLANGDPENAFVLVTVRILRGRDEPTRRRVGEEIFGALRRHLQPVADVCPLAISLEVQEIDAVSFAWNTLRTTGPDENHSR